MKITFFLSIVLACWLPLYGQSSGSELVERADKFQRQGNYEEAIALYSQALSANPGLVDAYVGRARAREMIRDHAGAVTDYSIYLELHPDNFDILLARANARYRLGHFLQALADYKRLLTLPPGETNVVMFQRSASPKGTRQITTAQSDLRPSLYNYIGLTSYKLEDYTQALAWLDSAILLQPREADYYVNRGMVYEKTSIEKAIADYEHALEIDSGHTQALSNLGVLRARSGDGSDYFDKAIESDESMLQPYLERAYHRMQGGFFKGALEDYNSALAIEKSDPEIWLNRGFVKERLNDPKGAYADYTEALRLKEDFGKAWLNRGNVLSKLGRYDEAAKDYTNALVYDPDYGPAYYNRAIAYEKLKRKNDACRDLLKAKEAGVEVDPKLQSAVCN